MSNTFQSKVQWLFGLAIAVLIGWILSGFLVSLFWAAIIALASWPLYQRFARLFQNPESHWIPVLFTLIVAGLFIAPLVYFLIQIAAQVDILSDKLILAQKSGIPLPDWISHLPRGITSWLTSWWNLVLGTPGGVADWLQHIPNMLVVWVQVIGRQMLHRSFVLVFTLLVLFFLFRDGAAISRQLLSLSRRIFGEQGNHHAQQAVIAVRATVNGLVLVGLGEGVLLGVAYAVVGIPSPVVWGAVTGFLAIVPFAAPVVFAGASLFLFTAGHTVTALGLFIWGTSVLFIADHFVRPALIGNAAKLPFLWVLLGILGGLETFGLLGVFLGPVIMAMGITLWRGLLLDTSLKDTETPS